MATKQQIIDAINGHMKKHPRTANSRWYVGVASDPEQALFVDHNVKKQSGDWIHVTADTAEVAKDAVMAYHNAGCKGSQEADGRNKKTVYAYLIKSGTIQ